MKKFAFIFFVLIASINFGQNGINYKAVAKDNNGNVIANQQITIRFTILKGTAQTVVYSETHTPTTDGNGIVMANIGEGTTTNNFADLNWASDKHYLKVEMNIGSGITDMGTTEFKTVPYALNVTGLKALDEGNGIGWRLVGTNPSHYGNIGWQAVDLSYSSSPSSTGASGTFSMATGNKTTASGLRSTAMGSSTTASGTNSTAMGLNSIASSTNSTAMGYSTTASAGYSTAMGENTTASGNSSTAMGNNTTASGINSTAMGRTTEASGSHATAMGFFARANSYASMAIGANNVGGGNPDTWLPNDPLFEIGNSLSSSAPQNAFTVKKNGNTGIGTAYPTVKLHIQGGTDAGLSSSGTGYLVLGEELGINMVFDNNEIMARNAGSTSPLYLQQNGGGVYVGGALVHSSDRRLKEDITDLTYGLDEILQLQPKSYHWKNREQTYKSLGLIAQDVQPIISEIVLIKADEDKMLSINYTELIPVLINAIKELKLENNNLRSELDKKDKQSTEFDQRLKQLEATLKNSNQ